jgi:hypothetical protein
MGRCARAGGGVEDHRRVSVMPHCIGLEGREAIDSTGASYGVIVWSAGRSRKLRENQPSKVQDRVEGGSSNVTRLSPWRQSISLWADEEYGLSLVAGTGEH